MRALLTASAMLLSAACAAHESDSRAETARRVESPAAVRSASPLRVAVTIDDLGVRTESADPALSAGIVDALRKHSAPVAVFANCQHLTDETLLVWRRFGATLGNHTTTHLSLDAAGPTDAWATDVESCDRRLRQAWGEPVRFFRFPYLKYGKTASFRDQAAQKLQELSYSIAHVTAATSEWLIASYYDRAVARGDEVLMAELAEAYVEHMVAALGAARELAMSKVGRDVAHITLLHVNQLAADHLSKVLDTLSTRGWQFVSLDAALADDVYARRDGYAGPCGCSWLARIEPALTPQGDYAFGDFETQLRERFEHR